MAKKTRQSKDSLLDFSDDDTLMSTKDARLSDDSEILHSACSTSECDNNENQKQEKCSAGGNERTFHKKSHGKKNSISSIHSYDSGYSIFIENDVSTSNMTSSMDTSHPKIELTTPGDTPNI